MTEPRDELLQRYADAATHDTSRPSARVRDAVYSHARMLAESRAAEPAAATVVKPGTHAANQSKWTLSLVASVVLLGFTGLLVVQIDRGAPVDREVALGSPQQSDSAPRPVAAPAVSPAPVPPVVIAVAPSPTVSPSPRPLQSREATAPPREARQDLAVQAAGPVVSADRPVPAAPPVLADRMASAVAQKAHAPHATESDATPAPAARNRALGTSQAVASTAAFFEAARTGQVATIDAWLSNGLPVNTRDDSDDTALMIAVAHQQPAVVKKLLAQGADPALINRKGQTALDLARGLQRSDLVDMLHPPR